MTADQAMATAESVGARIGGEAPRLTGPQVITNELISSIATSSCGWSKRQLELLGIGWPPPSGWRLRLASEERSLSAEQVTALYDARKKPKRPLNSDGLNSDGCLIPTPCPWCGRLVEPVTQGGRIKEFCCKKHKNSYNAALNRLSLSYARTIRVPGSLQTWAAQRVDPTESDLGGLPRTNEQAALSAPINAPETD